MIEARIKFVESIGLYSINRPRTSCRHATSFCKLACYHKKFENMLGEERISKLADAEEEFWRNPELGIAVMRFLETRRAHPTNRFRLMSRGEALRELKDVERVKKICRFNPDTLFMLPTRAWRNKRLLEEILKEFLPLRNLRLLFSTDPTCFDAAMKQRINNSEHPMMSRVKYTFFGNDNYDNPASFIKCPKTWKIKKGVDCSNCKIGCFVEPEGFLKVIHFKTHR